MENENYYSTSDLCLIALLSLTNSIESYDRTEPKRVTFKFKNTPELKKLIDKFNLKKVKVEPFDYYNQLRKIKTMIYDTRNKQRATVEK